LDVGVGNGWLGNLAKLYHPNMTVIEGIEAYKDSVLKAEKFYTHIYNDTVDNVFKTLPSKKYDVVTCINTIEHFERPLAVLEEMERVAKKAVFVITLNFYYQQGDYGGNTYQRHLSVIPSTVLKKRGYTVRPNGKLVETFGVVAKFFPRLDSQYIGWKYF
jgi:2-polyprenyl-3-methyl-5-hydroxy-6-metoxy-1,4-benzoquinol methylase